MSDLTGIEVTFEHMVKQYSVPNLTLAVDDSEIENLFDEEYPEHLSVKLIYSDDLLLDWFIKHLDSNKLTFEDYVNCRDYDAPIDAKLAYIEDHCSWDECNFDDTYRGSYDTMVDYVWDLIDEGCFDCGTLNPSYINAEAIAHDLECEGYHCVNGFIFGV